MNDVLMLQRECQFARGIGVSWFLSHLSGRTTENVKSFVWWFHVIHGTCTLYARSLYSVVGQWLFIIYSAMLRRVRYCYGKLSVCPCRQAGRQTTYHSNTAFCVASLGKKHHVSYAVYPPPLINCTVKRLRQTMALTLTLLSGHCAILGVTFTFY